MPTKYNKKERTCAQARNTFFTKTNLGLKKSSVLIPLFVTSFSTHLATNTPEISSEPSAAISFDRILADYSSQTHFRAGQNHEIFPSVSREASTADSICGDDTNQTQLDPGYTFHSLSDIFDFFDTRIASLAKTLSEFTRFQASKTNMTMTRVGTEIVNHLKDQLEKNNRTLRLEMETEFTRVRKEMQEQEERKANTTQALEAQLQSTLAELQESKAKVLALQNQLTVWTHAEGEEGMQAACSFKKQSDFRRSL